MNIRCKSCEELRNCINGGFCLRLMVYVDYCISAVPSCEEDKEDKSLNV